jgi:hypothetical protein
MSSKANYGPLAVHPGSVIERGGIGANSPAAVNPGNVRVRAATAANTPSPVNPGNVIVRAVPNRAATPAGVLGLISLV